MESEPYTSEYEAPPYTILSRVDDGDNVITSVIIDDEIVEFINPK